MTRNLPLLRVLLTHGYDWGEPMGKDCRLYCVGHKSPLFDVPLRFTMLVSTAGLHENEQVIPDDRFDDQCDGSLSEYAQLFGLAELMSRETSARIPLYVFQYRKFLSPRPGSVRAENQPWCFVASPQEASAIFPDANDLARLHESILIGPRIGVGSLMRNYCTFHVAEDFAGLVASLTEVDGFTHRRIGRLINCPVLFPVPSLGCYPSDFFISTMHTLKSAWEVFCAHYRQSSRGGYQRRVGGFLLERLHSFLLMEYLESVTNVIIREGAQIVVSDSPTIQLTV